jgi:intein/homing endonuclease
VTFKQLAEDWSVGITHDVASWDSAVGSVVYRTAWKPRITKIVTEIILVQMENGEVFRCTPDHLFMLADGTYVPAEDLQPGTELNS